MSRPEVMKNFRVLIFVKKFLNFILTFLVLILILDCGIKSDPQPPPKPEVRIKRIGSYVFVIPKFDNIAVKNFKRKNGIFFKKKEERFCFEVKRTGGKSRLFCVKEALKYKPKVKIRIEDEEIKVYGEKGKIYRVYIFEKDFLNPMEIAEFKGNYTFKRSFKEKTLAITEVYDERESDFIKVYIPPVEPPGPEAPEGASIVIRKGRIYIFWGSSEGATGYNIYRDGKKLNKEPVKATYFIDSVPEKETVYEIRAVNEFGVESEPARVLYKP